MHAPWLVLPCLLNEVAQHRAKDGRTCGQTDPIPCLSLLVPLVPEKGISHRKPSDLSIRSPVMSLTRIIAGIVSSPDEVNSSMEVKGTLVRSYARRSRIHPPVHPRAHQSKNHSMSVLSLKFMDHALYLSAPLQPSVHQNRWDFNVLKGTLQHVTPLIFHSQSQNGVGCRVGRGTCTSKDGHLSSSMERSAAGTELHNVYSMALSVCRCANCFAPHRIGAALVCPACSGTVFATLLASC